MDQEFWQERWRTNRIAFHEKKPHQFLREHLKSLDLRKGDTVFVPLCGKSCDIDWLLSQGLQVVGIELNQQAIESVFDRLELAPRLSELGNLFRYEAGGLVLYLGDFFDLSAEQIGKVHATYDRAALVALPEDMRPRYADHLASITERAPQLTIAYSYDQKQTPGPPFSVPARKIKRLYADAYHCVPLDSRLIQGPLATRCSGEENALLLVPNC
ncbi:MAG: thiopurine S-methyltransferase [Pseudomonadota bacterium]